MCMVNPESFEGPAISLKIDIYDYLFRTSRADV